MRGHRNLEEGQPYTLIVSCTIYLQTQKKAFPPGPYWHQYRIIHKYVSP